MTDAATWIAISRAVRAAIVQSIEHPAAIESAVTAAVSAILMPVSVTPRSVGADAAARPPVMPASTRDAQSAALLAELAQAERDHGTRSAATIVARRHCDDPSARESLERRLRRLRSKKNGRCPVTDDN